MLTPPGLKGKQYRISGKAYPRLSRPGQKRRRVVRVIGAVVALALIGWGTVQLVAEFGGKKKPTAAAGGHCAVRPATAAGDAARSSASSASPHASASGAAPSGGASGSAAPGASASGGAVAMVLPSGVPQPSTFTVNVYNATGHAGLAGQTANLLRQRGFKIGKIANAPATLEGKVTGLAQITGATGSKAAMTLVGSEVSTAVSGITTTNDTRTDGSIDLVIGNGFTALLSPAQAAQALSLAVSPSPTAAHC